MTRELLTAKIVRAAVWSLALAWAWSDHAASDAGAKVFTARVVWRIELTISAENLAALRASPRQYVSAGWS